MSRYDSGQCTTWQGVPAKWEPVGERAGYLVECSVPYSGAESSTVVDIDTCALSFDEVTIIHLNQVSSKASIRLCGPYGQFPIKRLVKVRQPMWRVNVLVAGYLPLFLPNPVEVK